MTDDLFWELLDSETAYSCPGFDVINETVRLPTGIETDFDYVSEGDSVVILPFTTDGDVVVIEEWREAVGRVNYGLPAGGLEPHDGEPAAAVERELIEETGYEAGEIEHLTTVEPANGFSDAVFHYFVAHDCTPTAEQDLDHNESIDVGTAAFEDLVRAVSADELRDGRAALAILYYHAFEA
ncbi:MAG: NUDIX hydrolase [Halapricum sp.]